MKTIVSLFFVLTLIVYPHTALAENMRHYILVLSKADQELKILDYNRFDPVGSVPIGEDPHEITLSTNQHRAYISNAMVNNQEHNIHIVDLKTLTVEKTIDTRPFYIPHGLACLYDRLWFAAQGSKAVAVYDVKTGKVTNLLGTGQDFAHLIQVAPDESCFYTTNAESGTVSIFEKKELPPYRPPTGILPPNAGPRLEWRQTIVNVGYGAEGFDISANGKELWIARPDGHVIIVDLAVKKIAYDIDTNVQGLHRLKFTPDGKAVAIVSVKTGDLLFYNARTRILEKQEKICKSAGLYMDKESNRMFVSCTPDNQLAIIDLISRKLVKTLPVGQPDSIIAARGTIEDNAATPSYGPQLEGFVYPAPVRRFRFSSQGQELEMAYLDYRPAKPNGQTVILLHGKNFCAATWDTTSRLLVQHGYRVIAPDQIGFCKSTKPEHYQYSFQQLARNTQALLENLGIRQAVFMGHSTGGMLGIRYALTYPDTVSKLVLVNPIGLEDWKAKGVPSISIDQWYERELKLSAAAIKKYEQATYYAGTWKPEYDIWVTMLAGLHAGSGKKIVAWNSALLYDMIYTQPVYYEFEQIRAPVLLLIGAKDNTAIGKDLAPPDIREKLGDYPVLAKAAAKRFPHALLHEFPDLGHAPQIQAPDIFHKALLQGLESQ